MATMAAVGGIFLPLATSVNGDQLLAVAAADSCRWQWELQQPFWVAAAICSSLQLFFVFFIFWL